MAFLNEDWELVSRFIIDLDKVVQKIKELNKRGTQANLKKQLEAQRKARNPNKYNRNKYERVIKK